MPGEVVVGEDPCSSDSLPFCDDPEDFGPLGKLPVLVHDDLVPLPGRLFDLVAVSEESQVREVGRRHAEIELPAWRGHVRMIDHHRRDSISREKLDVFRRDPPLVADLHGEARTRRQSIEGRLETAEEVSRLHLPDTKIGELEHDRAELLAERRQRLEKRVEAALLVTQDLVEVRLPALRAVCDQTRNFRREAEVLRRALCPPFDHLDGRYLVERRVHLDAAELSGVAGEVVTLSRTFLVEGADPVLVGPSGGSDVELVGDGIFHRWSGLASSP